MIQFNELRIGNYVLINGTKQKIAMVSNGQDKHKPFLGYYVDEELQYIECDSTQLQAVSLSDNELKEGGFSFDTYFKLWQRPKSTVGTGMEMELDRDYSVVDFMRRPLLKEIKSMHNLQNVYYALVGKELTFIPVQTLV